MKTALRKLLPLLLCLILCICLAPAAWAEDEAMLIDDTDMFLTTEESLAFEADIGESLSFTAAGEILTVTFNANGGTGTMAAQEFVKGDPSKPLNFNTFTRDGYTFIGWNEKADGTGGGGRIIKDGANFRVSETYSSSKATLYAQWEEIITEDVKVVVSFHANGGTGYMEPQVFKKGGAVKSLNANTFTRDGYAFAGWNTEADGSGTNYADQGYITVTDPITLYAMWQEKVSVWFYPGKGNGSATYEDYVKGSYVELLSYGYFGFEAPAGQIFVGWEIEGEDRLYKSGDFYVFNTEKKVVARWGDTITITYDPNGANVPSRKLQRAAKNYDTRLANMSQIGYTRAGLEFLGWALTPGAKEPKYLDAETVTGGFSQNTTLYAVWRQYGFVGIVITSGSLSSSNNIGFIGETLAVSVTNEELFTDYSYQWKRDGLAINGATSETYVPTIDDFGHTITCDVTANDAPEGKTKSSSNYKYISVEEDDKRIINNGATELDYVHGLYDGMYYSVNNGAKQTVSLTDGVFPVTQQGIYRFYTDLDNNTPVATVDVYNWWTFGYKVANISSTYFGSGSGTASMRNNNMTLSSSTRLWDEEGNTIILTSYSVPGFSNAWILREGADISNITLTIRPSVSSYLFCSLNGGEDLVSNTETTINLGQITGSMMYDIRFSRTPPSVPVAPIDEEHFPDPAFRRFVLSRYDLDTDGILSNNEIDRVTNMSCSNYGIRSMKGIELFNKLNTLYCQSNILTELDLRGCTLLQALYCSDNVLSSLDLSQCPNLTSLNCSSNSLTKLDLSMCPGLMTLTCSNNVFASLDLHACSALTSLSCFGNVLSHLDVSACDYLTSLDCNNNLLKTLDLHNNPHLRSLNCNGNIIRSIDLVNNTELTTLHCSGNLLTEINIGSKPILNRLDCSGNLMSQIDLSSCPNLRTLNCYENNLLQLNITDCPSLTVLDCHHNMLSSLDVSACTRLRQVDCSGNLLDSLDLSGYRSLSSLSCNMNNLVQLQITDCDALKSLRCEGNKLADLDLSGCTALLTLLQSVEPFVDHGIVTYSVGYLNSAILSFDEKTMINTGAGTLSPDLSLPASLTGIEDEAFAGGSFEYVRVPAGVTMIGSRAFADCPNLKYVEIQGMTTGIAPDAFYGTYGITIYAPLNSSAAAFANEHGIDFHAIV